MHAGELFLRTAMAAAVASAALFLPSLRGKKTPFAPWALGLHASALVAALAILAEAFLAHRFEVAYVASYSSRALSPALSLAALWAGQEGSILLWVAIGALLALALLRQPGALARPALFFVSLAQVAMMGLLMVRSPFVLGEALPDGRGLNPLLEDPWMVVHPPALFVGYAAMLVPSALAMAALFRGEYRDWNRMAWPWVLFAVVTLGVGIALGGVWAYKVLGWGGYWGWDPVENASLIPWLAAVAMLHGLLIQRTTGAVTRTNLLLALLGWTVVLGGTYLTRSGMLQDFSVHSFADSGLNAPLTTFLLATVVLSAGLLAYRWRTIEAPVSNWVSVSRESALWLGMMTVLVLMVLVAFGTAAPLITSLFGAPASVRTTFYEMVSVPLGIVLLGLMGIAPALRWSRQQGITWVRALWPALAAIVVTFAVALATGMRQPSHLAIAALSAGALAINAVVTVRLFRRGWSYGAGYLGHAGIAVMVLGMVLSTGLGRTERVQLPQGESVQAMGYSLAFHGTATNARGQTMLQVSVEKPGFRFEARPMFFDAPNGEGQVRSPALARNGELYLSPVEVTKATMATGGEPFWVERGREAVIDGVGYTFHGFRMEDGPELRVLADLEIRSGGSVSKASPGMIAGKEGTRPLETEVPGLGSLSVVKIDADRHRVAVMRSGLSMAPAVALLDFSSKPLIPLVWIGALIAVLGTGLAGVRRAAERRPRAEKASAAAREHAVARPSA
jgi:cytochrome c-type biogenesis protein CcmF